jgi:VWFA-related protein
MKRLAVMLAAALATAIAFAQQPYFETFEVRLHNLDVVVTDAKDHSVHGLTKDDFLVLEDGVPQTITNFSVYDSRTSTVSSVPVRGAAQAATQPAQEAPPPRRFVFFVDDMAVHARERKTLIRHATRLVDEMRAGDLAAVIRPTGAQRVAQDYTTDTDAVRASVIYAIESCRIRGDAPGLFELQELQRMLENAESEGERMMAKATYAARARARVQQRFSQLRSLIASMGSVEGRKVLVVITSGLPSYPGRDAIDFIDQMKGGAERLVTEWGEPGRDFLPLIDEMARTAAANGVTIYALEPEVPLTVGVQRSAASRTVGTTAGRWGVADKRAGQEAILGHVGGSQIMPPNMADEILHYRGQTLTSLTEKTGGKWFRGAAEIDDVFRQVASDLQVYYSLAYRATGTRDKPRHVEVRIRNRPELRARTRTDVVDRSPEREMGDLTAANLLFPRALNELRIAVTASGKPTSAAKIFTVPVDVVIPLDALTFTEAGGGKYTATVDIHFAAAAHATNYTTAGRHRQNIEMPAAQYASRTGVTYRFKTGIDMPAGPTRVAIGVMDVHSRLAGFGNVEVNAK